MDRRTFVACLGAGCGTAALASLAWHRSHLLDPHPFQAHVSPPAFAIIPIVGDGKWVWREPPDETGYLEPRDYDVEIGIEIRGQGRATDLRASTPVPVPHDHQQIQDGSVDRRGCQATVQRLDVGASHLAVSVATLAAGQVVSAAVRFRMTLFKEHHGYGRDQFARNQQLPAAIRRRFLQDSPGIQTRIREVRSLVAELTAQLDHPWDQAETFHAWVWEHIEGRPGAYTNVETALRQREGDCEERAAVFVALCRAAGIPARLVWVPNHNWAEFWLHDHEGRGQWIPAHTAGYSWFGYTGAHELVLQKGDRIPSPSGRRPVRLLTDWVQWSGRRPHVTFSGRLEPVAASAVEAGPGARRKNERGEWQVLPRHPLDAYLRDGPRCGQEIPTTDPSLTVPLRPVPDRSNGR